ncbi:hypothetical protein ACSV5G_10740 [Agrobacterium cavarae]|uniref:hypothetical protein n=1 Tax=Agrobacterium cavarae TaxID=2528239 RepID=UPI003FD56ECC
MKAKLSADSSRAKLRLIERAQQDAANELPATQATALGPAESAIIEHCQEYLDKAEDNAREELTKIAAKVPQIPYNSGDLSKARVKLGNDIEAAVNAYRSEISGASAELQRRRREYMLFRRKNGLEYEPSYPKSIWLYLGIIIFMALAESAANAFFFAEASDRGLSGGFFEALTISLLNIAIGFGTGILGFRYITHRSNAHKLWAVPAVLMTYLWCIWFNLVVAFYRESLTRDPNIPLEDAVTWDLTELIPPGSFNSLVLFVIGVLVFTIAAYEGSKMFGTYPGYRPKHRALVEAEDRLQNMKDDVRGSMQDALDENSEDIQQIISATQNTKSAILNLKGSVAAVVSRTHTQQTALAEMSSQLIGEYRSENSAIRQTKPPAYFGTEARLRVADIDREAKGFLDHWEELAATCDQLSSQAENDLKEFQDTISKRLENIDAVTAGAETEGREKAEAEAAQLAS